VTGGNELNGRALEGFKKLEVLFARKAEDVFDAFIFEAADKEFGGIHGGGLKKRSREAKSQRSERPKSGTPEKRTIEKRNAKGRPVRAEG